MKREIAEIDLYMYYLAIEKKYYELLELYGLLFQYTECPHCKKDTGLHFKVMKELIATFGGIEHLRIPKEKDIQQIARDITIWKGLKRCEDALLVEKVAEYSERYELTTDAVYKIRHRVEKVIERFMTAREVYTKRRAEVKG